MIVCATDSTNTCELCGRRSGQVMGTLGVCRDCIITETDGVLPRIQNAHRANRRIYGLAEEPPRAADGVRCALCSRACTMDDGDRGFCNLREGTTASVGGSRLHHLAGRPSRGMLHWYRDPLPTNCVSDWVCAGHQRRGMHNLAVFYASCSFNCLFCQNWHYRRADPSTTDCLSDQALADCADTRTHCVCYFGGDPASQMPHALASARRFAALGVRVCWETNGSQNPKLLDRAVQLSMETGGTLKFDLKAFDERLHIALTGASNRRTLANFERAARRAAERRPPPLVVASTLLVPGYVTPDEVSAIAGFIASIDPEIPYSLLAFAPQFAASDLPPTSLRHAREAEQAARNAGLGTVRIGNRHLLTHDHSGGRL
jgi:pyruvate formate lyase activating enzyme